MSDPDAFIVDINTHKIKCGTMSFNSDFNNVIFLQLWVPQVDIRLLTDKTPLSIGFPNFSTKFFLGKCSIRERISHRDEWNRRVSSGPYLQVHECLTFHNKSFKLGKRNTGLLCITFANFCISIDSEIQIPVYL